jgi:hypothetical protein
MPEDVLDQTTAELDPVEADFYDAYAEAAAVSGTLPPDGSYKLRLPDTIPDSAFVVKVDKASGKKYLEVGPLDVTIAEGPFEGYVAKFVRTDTRQIPEFKRDGSGFVATGKLLNASDAADILMNFGTGDRPTTKAEWVAAFTRIAGQVTPHAVYLTWSGYDKKASGKAKYLKSKDFKKLADGTRPNFIERTDAATGEVYKAFANLRPGRRGWAPRVEKKAGA